MIILLGVASLENLKIASFAYNFLSCTKITRKGPETLKFEKITYRPPLYIPADPPTPLPPHSADVSIRASFPIPSPDCLPFIFVYGQDDHKQFSTMTVQEFKDKFLPTYHGPNDPDEIYKYECKQLTNFELYQYPNFLEAGSSLGHYEQYIIDLRAWLNKFDISHSISARMGFELGDIVAKEFNKIIDKRCALFGCLNLNDKVALEKLAGEHETSNRKVSRNTDKSDLKKRRKNPEKERLKKRLTALKDVIGPDTPMEGMHKTGKRLDYSNRIKEYPTFTDPYASAFDHRCGTILDMELHKDLCDTRVMMLYLQDKYRDNALVQSYGPMINRITALAKLETNVGKAFNLADYAYDVVGIVASGSGAIATGVFKAVEGAARAALRPQTYVEAAIGVLELGVFLATGAEPMDEFDIANAVTMFPANSDTLFKVSDEYQKCCEEQAQAAQKSYEEFIEQLNKMTWQEKTSLVAQGVTMVTMPWLLPRTLKLAGMASGRKLVSNLASIIKSTRSEEVLAGIGAVEKIAIEEGVGIARVTSDVIKRNSGLLGKKGNGKPLVQIVREVAKDVVETKDFGKVACADGSKCWLKLSPDELKKIGPVSARSSDIKEVVGTAQDAFEFFEAQVVSHVEKKPGLLYGESLEGIRFSYRAVSTTEPYGPTIDIVGLKGLRKLKFKN